MLLLYCFADCFALVCVCVCERERERVSFCFVVVKKERMCVYKSPPFSAPVLSWKTGHGMFYREERF